MSGDSGGRVEGGGNFNPRQFQREARERRTEAEALAPRPAGAGRRCR